MRTIISSRHSSSHESFIAVRSPLLRCETSSNLYNAAMQARESVRGPERAYACTSFRYLSRNRCRRLSFRVFHSSRRREYLRSKSIHNKNPPAGLSSLLRKSYCISQHARVRERVLAPMEAHRFSPLRRTLSLFLFLFFSSTCAAPLFSLSHDFRQPSQYNDSNSDNCR